MDALYFNPNQTVKKLKQIKCKMNQLDLEANRARTLERKQDTRRKIELGGLIKKAGLHDESASVLLGLLLDAKDKIEEDENGELKKNWKLKGDIAFSSK